MSFGVIFFWFSVVFMFCCLCHLFFDVAFNFVPEQMKKLGQKYIGDELKFRILGFRAAVYLIFATLLILTIAVSFYMYFTYFIRQN